MTKRREPAYCQICGNLITSRFGRITCSRACANIWCSQHVAHSGNPTHSDETRAEITRLWADGVSATQIGNALGLRKNQVIGIVHRLRLPSRLSPIGVTARVMASRLATRQANPVAYTHPDGARAVAEARKRSAQAEAARTLPIPPAAPLLPAPAMPRSTMTCQFITSSRRPWIFCDAPAKPGGVYCDAHHRICYTRHPLGMPWIGRPA